MSPTKTLTGHQYEWFRNYLHSHTGISLGDGKQLLVEGRLGQRLRALKLDSFDQYLKHLKVDKGQVELGLFVNALTTNMTSFFREDEQLYLAKDIWEKEHRAETVYVWSAACSSGEEVYSLAMLLEESRAHLPGFDYRVLGSDIDTQCLARAGVGVYQQEDMGTLPAGYLKKYFVPEGSATKRSYSVRPALAKRVKFRKLNLVTDGGPSLAVNFHFIYLRNVLIYFEEHTVAQIIRHLEQRLKPGGFLFLGHSETIDPTGTSLVKTSTSCYQRRRAA